MVCLILAVCLLWPQLLLSKTGDSEMEMDTKSEPGPGAIEKRMQKRRDMLESHQFWGLLAWAFWLATNIEGEAVAKTLERRGQREMDYLFLSDPNRYRDLYLIYQMTDVEYEPRRSSGTHLGLASATWLTYSIAAYYALSAPERFEEARHRGFDSIFLHKGLAFLHFAAMAALPSLRELPEREGPRGAQKMRNVGWGGFGVYTIAIATFYF